MAEHTGIDFIIFLFILGAHFDSTKSRFDKDLVLGCAAVSNFCIVSGVRRIKGFKRYQGEKCRAGMYLEDIKNEYCLESSVWRSRYWGQEAAF